MAGTRLHAAGHDVGRGYVILSFAWYDIHIGDKKVVTRAVEPSDV
jgi:hypothetical protein